MREHWLYETSDYIDVRIFMFTHTVYLCSHMRMHMYTHMHTHTCTHAHMHACIHTYTCILITRQSTSLTHSHGFCYDSGTLLHSSAMGAQRGQPGLSYGCTGQDNHSSAMGARDRTTTALPGHPMQTKTH